MDHPTSSLPTSLNPTDDGLPEEHKQYSDSVRVTALVIGIPIIIFGFLGEPDDHHCGDKDQSAAYWSKYLHHQSVFDLMYVSIVVPTNVCTIWNNGWVFSNVYCNIYPLVAYLTLGGIS